MIELMICTFGCCATLLTEHAMLWRSPWRLRRTAAYCLGTATLALWYFIWSMWIGVPGAGIAFVFLAGSSGSTIIIAYWLRDALDILKRQSREAGKAEAEMMPPFNPYLTQADLDGGLRGPHRVQQTD